MFINHYSAKSLCARGAMLNLDNYSIQYFEELNARSVDACLELQMPPRRPTQEGSSTTRIIPIPPSLSRVTNCGCTKLIFPHGFRNHFTVTTS
jgi:hypothetical protein